MLAGSSCAKSFGIFRNWTPGVCALVPVELGDELGHSSSVSFWPQAAFISLSARDVAVEVCFGGMVGFEPDQALWNL